MTKRVIPIILIYIALTFFWFILGGSNMFRTYSSQENLRKKVSALWGEKITQKEPSIQLFYYNRKGERVYKKIHPNSSDIIVDLKLKHRRKGLVWFSTYKVDFKADYTVRNTIPRYTHVEIDYAFPNQNAIYDDFTFLLNGRKYNYEPNNPVILRLPAGRKISFSVSYTSQGLDEWLYSFGTNYSDKVAKIKNFSLKIYTDFRKIDFPDDTISPTSTDKTNKGWELHWKYKNLVSGFKIGVATPQKLQPGELARSMSFFAPISLLFFIFWIFIISVLKKLKIHPMHYLLLGLSFFAFHLLFSYLADHLSVYICFLAASVVSLFLVYSYMKVVVSKEFALREVGLAQFIYLILFSLAHFFRGYTGLTVTIGSIITLYVVMQLTAKVNWDKVFAGKR
ncbi:inner membrane CreD family protein [Candidatus Margulisiibacteriota bacterium]